MTKFEEHVSYDVTLKCPFNLIIAGATGSGKTSNVFKLLKFKDIICSDKIQKVHYFYSLWQPLYNQMKELKLVDNFINGIPNRDELLSIVNEESNDDSVNPTHQLLVFDDLMISIARRKDDLMSQLMTIFGHHKNLSVVIVSQLLFQPGDKKYTVLTENCHYLMFLKSPRNSSKIIHLGMCTNI